MTQFISEFFNNDFMPHGHCYFWTPSILWLHVASDVVIFASYVSIAIAISWFISRRQVYFGWIFWMFGGFILLCGFTHAFDVYTTWVPNYGIEGLIKLLTAAISAATAIALWPLLPKALSLPSKAELAQAHEKLKVFASNMEEKVRERTKELQDRNRELEILNKARTFREDRIIELKKQVNALQIALGEDPEYSTEHDE